jgi:hypothetical protein
MSEDRQSLPADDTPDAAPAEVSAPPRKFLKTLLTVAKLVAATGGAFLFLLIVSVGFAGWYTSRPQFCRSCHIMEPYYQSWMASKHKDVTCIECHFEPGFGGEVRGKMLGLVQLAKYVTGSAGPRPAAEIPDASCLRSGCHENRLLSGKVQFHGVTFDHGPHMGQMRRGKKLRCTSCHSQIVQGEHMAVTETTCFLCHFKDEPFNAGLGACTRCHQIPEKTYGLGGGVKFTHELAYTKGVDWRRRRSPCPSRPDAGTVIQSKKHRAGGHARGRVRALDKVPRQYARPAASSA